MPVLHFDSFALFACRRGNFIKGFLHKKPDFLPGFCIRDLSILKFGVLILCKSSLAIAFHIGVAWEMWTFETETLMSLLNATVDYLIGCPWMIIFFFVWSYFSFLSA